MTHLTSPKSHSNHSSSPHPMMVMARFSRRRDPPEDRKASWSKESCAEIRRRSPHRPKSNHSNRQAPMAALCHRLCLRFRVSIPNKPRIRAQRKRVVALITSSTSQRAHRTWHTSMCHTKICFRNGAPATIYRDLLVESPVSARHIWIEACGSRRFVVTFHRYFYV
jgi:hypothetical protein